MFFNNMFSYNSHDPHFTVEPRSFSSHLDCFPFSPPQFINNQDNTLHDIFSTTPQPSDEPQVLPPSEEMAPSPMKNGKRSARKDRHSKIVTAQGPRDRRMRLNLEVAPQFFDIQDMLGYDKGSKTVQWLMNEAKSSIDKLKAATRPPTAHSRSTEASTSELECKSSASQRENIDQNAKKRVGRHPSIIRRATCPPNPLTKESRAMARARARERTREKKNNGNLIFSNSIPVEAMDEESGSHDLRSSLDLVDQMEEQCSPSSNNGERAENELSVSILDYEQWPNQFASNLDVQIQTRLW